MFTQFSSDLDKATQTALDHGKQLMEILKQPLYHPMSVSRQAVILYISTGSLLADVPLAKSREVAQGFVDYLENTQPQLLEEIDPPARFPPLLPRASAPNWMPIRDR